MHTFKYHVWALLAFAILCLVASGCSQTQMRTLSKQTYIDKCKGAWIGQMVGVSYGAPYEFEYRGEIMEDPIRDWRPAYIRNSLYQDDCYVEMTWLESLHRDGLDITCEEAGLAFASETYGLAHANNYGRENVRHGIMPPLSGHPKYNKHADDIDFQIESDVLGIICPGLPQQSNELCDVFGHIMNYGDGVYGGMFVAGMYTAAYFESEDVLAVVEHGLACIPPQSQYHQCISDTIRWYHQHPNDWRKTWRLLEDKWQDDIDCVPNDAFNIDAKINGAYIVMGLLYGEGDLARTLEVSTRCGQDNDCNPSNAAGVLCCMKGFSKIDPKWKSGIHAVSNNRFAHSRYDFESLIDACTKMTEQIIEANGGQVFRGAPSPVGPAFYRIPQQRPEAAPLEQWVNQEEIIFIAVPQQDLQWWDPAWTVEACGLDLDPGYKVNFAGRKHVMMLAPVSIEEPAVMSRTWQMPEADQITLNLPLSSFGPGDWLLRVYVNDTKIHEKRIFTHGHWTSESVDLSSYAGQTIELRIEADANDSWLWDRAYFGRITIETNEQS